MLYYRLLLLLFCFNFFSCSSTEDDKTDMPSNNPTVSIAAFSGAEGEGVYTVGGRDGVVRYVTNLNDDGSGSLREAVNWSNNVTIVFLVSGTVKLQSPLLVTRSNITIAGQTAPGKGITLSNYTVKIMGDNIIIRFLRFRLGYNVNNLVAEDAIEGQNRRNILIDHCSMSWSVDECASFYDNENFTMQWCLISESLRNSGHPKGTHGYGGIWGGRGASFHHNLLAHHDSRNPRFCGSRFSNLASKERVDFRNNVIYNWAGNSTYGGEGGVYNIVNNYYKAGPATKKGSTSLQKRIFSPNADAGDYLQAAGVWGKYYVSGNYVDGFPDVTASNWDGGVQPYPSSTTISSIKLTAEQSFATVTTQSAQDAYISVLNKVGASFSRDTIDKRIVAEVTNCSFTYTGSNGSANGIIDNEQDVGGWPEVAGVIQQQRSSDWDSDYDGMPNQFEDAHGLNKNNASDRNNKTLDPNGQYTNLEMYLNSIVSHLY